MTPWTVAIKLLCPWGFSGKSTGVGCHFLFQGIFPAQGLNPHLLHHVDSLPLSHGEVPGAIMGDPTHDEVMKKIPDMQGYSGYKGPSRLALTSTPPCILPPFMLLFLFALLQILVLPAESSPAPLSLNKDQLKTLINKSPRRWYPMKGPGMKKCFNSNPFAGILACLINVCSHCKRLAGDFLQVVNF